MALSSIRALALLGLVGLVGCGWEGEGSLTSSALSSRREAVTSAEACAPAPSGTQLVYMGPGEAEVGEGVPLAALLTDASGVPLAGREVRFEAGAAQTSATTDAWGLARVVVPVRQVLGDVAVGVAYAGDSASAPAQATAVLIRWPGVAKGWRIPSLKASGSWVRIPDREGVQRPGPVPQLAWKANGL
jgi:hypothetical protein